MRVTRILSICLALLVLPGGVLVGAVTRTQQKQTATASKSAKTSTPAKPAARTASSSRGTQVVRPQTSAQRSSGTTQRSQATQHSGRAAAPASRASSNTRTTTSSRTAASSRTSTASASRGRQQAAKAPVRRSYVQATPTPDRYREIQQALAEKGFYKGEATGTWGPDSVDALKRFQQEQQLEPSGKLDSVSLIALGLGPKRNLAARSNPESNTLPRPQDDNRRSQGSERP